VGVMDKEKHEKANKLLKEINSKKNNLDHFYALKKAFLEPDLNRREICIQRYNYDFHIPDDFAEVFLNQAEVVLKIKIAELEKEYQEL
jgi:hypothetical protein